MSVQNKSRMLRLLYGDVYCAERTFRFGLSDGDICRRCFATETIAHLLTECPYTLAVYSILGINDASITEILGVYLKRGELEIRADLLSSIIFRQNTLPPEILIKATLEKYAKGLSVTGGTDKIAANKIRLIRSNEMLLSG